MAVCDRSIKAEEKFPHTWLLVRGQVGGSRRLKSVGSGRCASNQCFLHSPHCPSRNRGNTLERKVQGPKASLCMESDISCACFKGLGDFSFTHSLSSQKFSSTQDLADESQVRTSRHGKEAKSWERSHRQEALEDGDLIYYQFHPPNHDLWSCVLILILPSSLPQG